MAAYVRDKRSRGEGGVIAIFCSCMEAHALLSGKGLIEFAVTSSLSLLLAEYLCLLLGYLIDFVLWTLLPSLGLALLVLDQQHAGEVRAALMDGDWSPESLQRCVLSHRSFFLNAVLYILLPLRCVQLASTLVMRARAKAAKKRDEAAADDDISRIGRALRSGDATVASRDKSPSSMTYNEVFGSRVNPLDRYNDKAPVPARGGIECARGAVVHIGGGARGDKGGSERYARLDLASTRGAGKRQKGAM